MAVEQSILRSVKKNLGLDDNYNAFDHDVITHVNSAFFTLHQLGIGPASGFMIEDEEDAWTDFAGPEVSMPIRNAIQSFIYLHVRLLFDPPQTAHHIRAAEEQKTEYIHRLSTEREITRWTPPSSSPSLP